MQPSAPRSGRAAEPSTAPAAVLSRYFGIKSLNPQRYAADFANLIQEVIQHPAVVEVVQLDVRVEISARHGEFLGEHKVWTVR